MTRYLKLFGVAGISLLISPLGFAAPVDLSTWIAQGGSSNWNVQAGNDAVLQGVNGNPTVFFDPFSSATQGTALNGKITVQTTGDDDFIGFVLGYDDSEIFSASSDYFLIDWKQGNQSSGGQFAPAGLALSHVTDGSTTIDFWGHSNGVGEVERGTNLGNTGWVDNQEYDFNIVFTDSLIEVKVDNALELSVSASDLGLAAFDDGAFGFYNYSQAQVLYSAIQQLDCQQTPDAPECQVSSVPEPGSLLLLGSGLAGALIRRRRRVLSTRSQ